MAFLSDRVLDLGLNVLDTEATHIYLCSAEPADFTAATTTVALGNKNFGAGNAFTAPADGTPNGRKVSSVAITDGSITATGTATHYAVVDSINSRLLAHNTLATPKLFTSGNQFGMPPFDITFPDA